MSSPLLSRANAYLLVTAKAAPTVVGGRIVEADSESYLVRCFLNRQQSSGTTTGADYLPAQFSAGDTLPGSSGVAYLYSGYGLQWAEAPSGYTAGDEVPDGLDWTSLAEGVPSWLTAGISCRHMQGIEGVKYCMIERTTGKYGNSGIDEIIIKEVGGIPLLVKSGDLID